MIKLLILILVLIDQAVKIGMMLTNCQVSIGQWKIGLEQSTIAEENIAYILASFIITILLIRYVTSNNTYIKKQNKIILSFAIAGVISNLIDRLWKGYILNYVYIPSFTYLNLSYIYIIITWLGLIILFIKNIMERFNEKENNSSK